jgi:16S rRNA (uracil1498-N3)-methyltransferase
MPRIFQPHQLSSNQELVLDNQASHHISRVLRMTCGQELTLFNGQNQECKAIIRQLTKKQVVVECVAVETISRESPCKIHLFQAVSKGDRMDFVVQKAVELGVHQITPVLSERSVVKLNQERWQKKYEHWQAIAISACEQCGRNQIPQINPKRALVDCIQESNQDKKIILNPLAARNHRDLEANLRSLALFIGPEGGFSSNEISCALSNGVIDLSLGPRILRTETAALSILSLFQSKYGDL